jgi:hypothetical protein
MEYTFQPIQTPVGDAGTFNQWCNHAVDHEDSLYI